MDRILMNKTEIDLLKVFADIHDAHTHAVVIESDGGSGIGCQIKVSCMACMAEEDISDYSSW
jgi:hypothetical protein